MADVVVAVDGSEASRRAVLWGAEEAARRGAPLRLVHASLWERYEAGADDEEYDAFVRTRDASRRMLAGEAERAAAGHPGLEISTALLPDETVPALLEVGRGAGLLVMGTRGRGAVAGVLLGSVSQRVAGRAAFPVVLVPGGAAAAPHGRVVLGLSPHEPPGEAGEFAAREAAARGAVLEVVHAWEPEVDLSALSVVTDAAAAQERARARLAVATAELELVEPGVKLTATAVPGPAAAALLEAAAQADLLVLGVRRRHGGLGRVAHALLHRAPCPVAVVPAPGRSE